MNAEVGLSRPPRGASGNIRQLCLVANIDTRYAHQLGLPRIFRNVVRAMLSSR